MAPVSVTQMELLTVNALGLQQRQWEHKVRIKEVLSTNSNYQFMEEVKRQKRNSQARRSRAKKRLGGDWETGRRVRRSKSEE